MDNMSEYSKKVLRIEKVEREHVIVDDKEVLKVDVQIIDPNFVPELLPPAEEGGERQPNTEGKVVPTIVERRSFSYDVTTTEDEIKQKLKKFIDQYNLEQEQKLATADQTEANKQVDSLINNLTDGVIK